MKDGMPSNMCQGILTGYTGYGENDSFDRNSGDGTFLVRCSFLLALSYQFTILGPRRNTATYSIAPACSWLQLIPPDLQL